LIQPVTTTLFKSVLEKLSLLTVPPKWFTDVSYHRKYEKVVAFQKLGLFKDDFSRFIEKQVVLTKGQFNKKNSNNFKLIYY